MIISYQFYMFMYEALKRAGCECMC